LWCGEKESMREDEEFIYALPCQFQVEANERFSLVLRSSPIQKPSSCHAPGSWVYRCLQFSLSLLLQGTPPSLYTKFAERKFMF
jgi:hypothetical protein